MTSLAKRYFSVFAKGSEPSQPEDVNEVARFVHEGDAYSYAQALARREHRPLDTIVMQSGRNDVRYRFFAVTDAEKALVAATDECRLSV